MRNPCEPEDGALFKFQHQRKNALSLRGDVDDVDDGDDLSIIRLRFRRIYVVDFGE